MIEPTSTGPCSTQAQMAIAATCTRIAVPIHIETGSTFLRCSTCAAPTTGESTAPALCNACPAPTQASENGMWAVIRWM